MKKRNKFQVQQFSTQHLPVEPEMTSPQNIESKLLQSYELELVVGSGRDGEAERQTNSAGYSSTSHSMGLSY